MKNVVGITAEYNPFHFGHLYQLSEIRRLLGEDCAVAAALSGDFVQRGEPALFSKFARAEAAVRSGLDLALELPVQWSCASAGYFARGRFRFFLPSASRIWLSAANPETSRRCRMQPACFPSRGLKNMSKR